MAWVGAAIGAAADIYSASSAKSGATGANRTNLILQGRQQAWEANMANTAVQRRMDDLQKAGINPLLAGQQGGADTPNVPAAHVENPNVESSRFIASAGSKAAQAITLEQVQAQTQKTLADARLSNAAAAQAEADVPFAASNSAEKNRQLALKSEELLGLARSAEAKGWLDQSVKQSDQAARLKMNELQVKYQEYVNEMAQAGIPEAQANAKLFKDLGEGGKAAQFLKSIIGGLSIRGGNTYNPTTIIRR